MEPVAATVSSGSCLCCSVRYTVDGPLRDVLQCHCHRCQKFTGNFMAASAANIADLDIADDDALRWYSPDDDPNIAYGFCRCCGSSLFWRVIDQGSGPFVSICAGTLDDAPPLTTTAIWFSDHAAPHTPLDPTIDHIASTDL